MKSGFWVWVLLGILLLIAMFVGAQWLADQRSNADSPRKTAEAEANERPPMIVCWGSFDVEPGVAALYPRQFGQIVELAKENTAVKKGDILLQVDDKLARLKIIEAKAAVKAADQQLAEARQLPKFYELQKEQQERTINASRLEVKGLRAEYETKIKSVDEKSAIAKTIREQYESGINRLIEKQKADEAKLKQIELQDASLKINQAEAELSSKDSQLKQAEEILEHFKIRAPANGIVLRVYVHKGESLGPTPRVQAIDFLPDAPVIVRAEVLQEWARFVKVGDDVVIEDDIFNGKKWDGKVKSISKWFAPTRSPVIEPFRYNDVRTLECLIDVTNPDSTLKIGQRVRAKIKIQP